MKPKHLRLENGIESAMWIVREIHILYLVREQIVYLLKQQHVESKAKCDDEEAKYDKELGKCFQNVRKHDDINS